MLTLMFKFGWLNANHAKSFALAMVMGIGAINSVAQPKPSKDIYPAPEAAATEIKQALIKAAKENKRIILDFGGNWCGDCRALNDYFHREPNASLVKSSFILVDVNIGKMDKNTDLAKTYGVPLNKGVPALAVLDSRGHPLFSQKNGEFESMRSLAPSALTQFLKHWQN
jgi:thioredoxin 1